MADRIRNLEEEMETLLNVAENKNIVENQIGNITSPFNPNQNYNLPTIFTLQKN
jgi:hypothetical protein